MRSHVDTFSVFPAGKVRGAELTLPLIAQPCAPWLVAATTDSLSGLLPGRPSRAGASASPGRLSWWQFGPMQAKTDADQGIDAGAITAMASLTLSAVLIHEAGHALDASTGGQLAKDLAAIDKDEGCSKSDYYGSTSASEVRASLRLADAEIAESRSVLRHRVRPSRLPRD